MADYELWYSIEGTDVIHKVIISEDKRISELRREIHKEWHHSHCKDVDAMQLVLMKVDIDRTLHQGAMHKLLAPDDATRLGPMQRINEVWLDRPNERHLHLCVRLPSAIHHKRSALEPEDVFSRLKRAKLATGAPSSIAKSTNYEFYQRNPSEKILDDCPKPDPDIPPIPLLYSGFGHFLDIMDGCDNVPGLADIEVPNLRRAVDDFANTMTMTEFTIEERTSAGLYYLTHIFTERRGTPIPRIRASENGSIRSDGHNIAANGISSIVVKFNNTLTRDTPPQVELVGLVAHLNTTNAEVARQLYLRWRAPCLGLTIDGCNIRFYAILALDHRFRLVNLTPAFSCIESASGGRDRRSLYLAFTAASVLQAQIIEDAQKLLSDPLAAPIPSHARHYPAVSRISKYPPSPGDYLTFEITHGYVDGPLYTAHTTTTPGAGEIIFIKFVRRYSIELHDFCAKAGHAPSILGYERLPGGWLAVAMEFIEPAALITKSDLLTSHRDRWIEELERLVDNFHAMDLVHGDLRDANIICRNDSLMLIDFDWGGKVGEASYPSLELNPELLEGRMSEDLRITKEDDKRVLMMTLDKLK